MITFKDFIQNEIKAIARSSLGTQKLVMRIFLLLVIALAFIYFPIIGALLPMFLKAAQPKQPPVETIHQIIFFFWLADLVLRLFLQKLPSTLLAYYLYLPIPKNRLIYFLLFKSLFSLPNAISIGLWWGFCFANFGFSMLAGAWALSILLIFLTNHLLIILLKNSFEKSIKGVALVIAVLLLWGIAEYIDWVNVRSLFYLYFSSLVKNQFEFLLIPVFIFSAFLMLTIKQISQSIYLESQSPKSIKVNEKSHYLPIYLGGLNYEKALFRRNKRIRTVLIVQAISMLYLGLYNMLLSREQGSSPFSGIFRETWFLFGLGFLVLLPMVFLSFTFTAESTFFDTFTSRPTDWRKFLLTKWKIASTISIFFSLIALPIVWLTFPKMLIWIAPYCLFQIGIGNFILLFKLLFHKAPFHIDTSAWFNYEGVSFAPFSLEILGFMPLIIPPVLYAFFATFHIEIVGAVLISLIGIIGIFLHQKWIDFLLKSWKSRRYEMLEGFKKK